MVEYIVGIDQSGVLISLCEARLAQEPGEERDRS